MGVHIASISRTIKELPAVRTWRQRRHERYFFDRAPEFAMTRRHSGVYLSWAEAVQSIPLDAVNADAAEQNRVSRVDYRKLYARDYPVLFWLSTILKSGARVFDFGGSIGIS